MDITTQRAAPTAALHLKGIDGQLLYSGNDVDKPVRIHFFSPGSKQASAVEARITQRILQRRDENDGKPNPAPPEVQRAEAAEDLALMTAKFENLEYPPAGDVQGLALYEALFADPDLGFVTDQAAKFLGNWKHFKTGSAPG